MTVGILKGLLEGVDDEMQVLIPTSPTFDGIFVSPCEVHSGPAEMGIYDPEDEKEALLLGKSTTRMDFVIVPHGFFNEEEGPNPELN